MLAYHELAGGREKDVYALPAETFRRHAEIIAHNTGRRAVLSFDDGHISNFSLAQPILRELRLPAMFFITTCWTGLLDSVMSWSQLREMSAAGFTIASHTHTHALLTTCGPAALRNELQVSRKLIEDRLGKPVDAISLPGGRGNDDVLRACRAAGYTTVYTSRVGQYRAATESMPEVIGRYVITRTTTERTLADYLQGSASTLRRLRFESSAKAWIKKLVGDELYRNVWRRVARSQSYGT